MGSRLRVIELFENTDDLPESFWSEEELDQKAEDVLSLDKYSTESTHLVLYHLYKEGVNTGLIMLICVESVMDGQDAINRLWSGLDVSAIVGEFSDESPLSQMKLNAIDLILHKHLYKNQTNLPGSDKVFNYEPWMSKLVN